METYTLINKSNYSSAHEAAAGPDWWCFTKAREEKSKIQEKQKSLLRLFLPFPASSSSSPFPERQRPLCHRLHLRQPRLDPGHAVRQRRRARELPGQRFAALSQLPLLRRRGRGRVCGPRRRGLEELGVFDGGRRRARDGVAQGRAERVEGQGEAGGVLGELGEELRGGVEGLE